MSERTEAEAAKLVQQWVNYALNLGLANAGPDFVLMSVEQMAVDLCQFNDMFEEIEPEAIQPYVEVWRQVNITTSDALTAASVRQYGEPID